MPLSGIPDYASDFGLWTASANNTIVIRGRLLASRSPPAQGGEEWMEKSRTPAPGAPWDYAIQDRDGKRFSQGGSARAGNRRRDTKVSSGRDFGKRQAPLLTHPRSRAPVEALVYGGEIRGPRDLQEARIGSGAQDRPARRYRGTGHVSRLRRVARAPAGNQPSQLPKGGGSHRMGERPAPAGESASSTGTGHGCATGAAPEPAPQIPDGRLTQRYSGVIPAPLPRARPQHALASARDRADAFVDELLHALAFVGLRRIQVAPGIDRNAVHAVELAGLAPAVAEVGHLLQRLAQHDAHFRVAPVRHEDVLLLRVLRERDIPYRSFAEAALREERLLDELAVRPEHLQPVVHAVADVQQVVVGEVGAVHRVAELLGRRRVRIVAAEVGVVRLVAVRAPVARHLAGIGVEHRHSLVAVAVCDVRLVGLRIDPDLGHPAEIPEIVAAFAADETTDLHQKFPVLGEFQDVGVLRAVAADPHVALVVDKNPVVRLRPLVALCRAAP